MRKPTSDSAYDRRVAKNTRKQEPPRNSNSVKFDATTFEKVVKEMQNGTIPLPTVTITDPQQPGLRAVIRKDTGSVAFHVSYKLEDGSRPYIKVGTSPAMSVATARQLTRTIHSLAAKGIDVQAGLHDRLVRELLDQGEKWRVDR